MILWSWPLLFWSRPEPSAPSPPLSSGRSPMVSRMVSLHIRRPVIKHLRIHVLLRVDIDLFTAVASSNRSSLKPLPLGLRPSSSSASSRQVPGERFLSSWYVRPMISGWSGSPFRKSTITSLAHPRYRQVTKSLAPPTPATPLTQHELLLRHPVITVPVKLHPYPAMFIAEDFLSRRAGDNGALWPVHLRFALHPWTPRPVRRYHL